jgi:chemotaxis protein methyltransferase CheR
MTIATQSVTSPRPPVKSGDAVDPVYRQIRDLVYKVSGMYKAEEKLYLLADGCGRRMKQLGAKSPLEYWDHLTAHPSRDGELRQLLNEITIGETCLFRRQPQLDALRKIILPEIVMDKAKETPKRLRIWSAGCSTGEESYTLAMSVLEESDRLLKGWTVEIIATDLNDRSVETAKAGIYGDYALRSTPDYFKRKYFSPVDEKKMQVRPEVKKLTTFSRLNLQDDSKMLFMKAMDLVFCCNVLIYFDGASKAKVINHFFGNLNFGGYFFLGTAESLMKLNDQFHLVHFPGTIAYWKPSGTANYDYILYRKHSRAGAAHRDRARYSGGFSAPAEVVEQFGRGCKSGRSRTPGVLRQRNCGAMPARGGLTAVRAGAVTQIH